MGLSLTWSVALQKVSEYGHLDHPYRSRIPGTRRSPFAFSFSWIVSITRKPAIDLVAEVRIRRVPSVPSAERREPYASHLAVPTVMGLWDIKM